MFKVRITKDIEACFKSFKESLKKLLVKLDRTALLQKNLSKKKNKISKILETRKSSIDLMFVLDE